MSRRRLSAVTVLVAVSALVTSVAANGRAGGMEHRAASGCTITQTHSIAGKIKTNIQFVNNTAGTVKVYWLDYGGKRVYYATLAPGASFTQGTFATNPWVVLDSTGACLAYVIAPHPLVVIKPSATSAAGGGGGATAAFVTAADAICTRLALAPAAPPTTTAGVLATLGQEIATVRKLVTSTLALPAPGPDVALVHAAMDDLTGEADALVQARSAVVANDAGAFKPDLAQANGLHQKARTIARQLGLRVCGA